jgi:hypothetical protein
LLILNSLIYSNVTNSEKLLIAAILFYSGLVFCLPVHPTSEWAETISYPWWASRIQFNLIILNEGLFIIWLLLFGGRFVLRNTLNKSGIPTRQAAICLIFLGVWCGVVSVVLDFSTITQNIGRTVRLILLAFMMIAVVKWARSLGTFVLLVFVFGILVGTVINLIISIQNPFILWGSFRLHGQNTPGVWMGLAAHLSAWLFALSDNVKTKLFSATTLFVCGFACLLSFSRIGWILLGLGLVSWFVILLIKMKSNNRKSAVLSIFLLCIPLSMLISSTQFSGVASDVIKLVNQKSWTGNDSNSERSSYIYGTTEIVLKNPLGVGYSGFYDAMIETEVYKSGVAARETRPKESNPHMTFLWYASTGGILGSLLSIALFYLLARIIKINLFRLFGRTGLVLSTCFIGSMLMIGVTVPYLFNSLIFYLPVAIIAGLATSRSDRGRGSDFLVTSRIIPK